VDECQKLSGHTRSVCCRCPTIICWQPLLVAFGWAVWQFGFLMRKMSCHLYRLESGPRMNLRLPPSECRSGNASGKFGHRVRAGGVDNINFACLRCANQAPKWDLRVPRSSSRSLGAHISSLCSESETPRCRSVVHTQRTFSVARGLTFNTFVTEMFGMPCLVRSLTASA